MSQIRFNQAFVGLMAAGALSALVIPRAVTDRAKGKADVLLYPVVKPVTAIASAFQSRYGEKPLPPGETRVRTDAELSSENTALRQQVVFLTSQIEELRLVEAEMKRLGPLLKYFKPVTVFAGDATPGRESLVVATPSDVNLDEGAWVLSLDGLVGRVEARRVRLITDKGMITSGSFGRWQNGEWIPIAPSVKASLIGAGNGAMRIEHLTLKEVADLKPGDWVIVADDAPGRELFRNRLIGQIDSIRPLAAKPLFAEITVKPKVDLRQLKNVLALRK